MTKKPSHNSEEDRDERKAEKEEKIEDGRAGIERTATLLRKILKDHADKDD